jgi:long-chain acyl-CoA synthetase
MRYERFLFDSARRHPEHVALVSGGQRLSYAALAEQASRFAAVLVEHAQLASGERCLLFLDNRIETAVAVFGTLIAGGVFSVINPATRAGKLTYMLDNCQASVLVTQASLLDHARAAAAQAPSVRRIIVVDAPEQSLHGGELEWRSALETVLPLVDTPRGIDIDLAMLVYTSGSTGRPKGVMMTHRNMVHVAASITTYLESRQDDVVLSVLPLAFDYGLYQLLMCVRMGSTLVLEKSFAFPQAILPKLASEGVTVFPLVPTMAALIVQLRGFKPEWAASVRTLTNTAAALPPAHIQRLRALFPAARVFSMYGVTESKRCTWLPPAELDRRPDSVGIAIPDTEVWVADDQGRPLPAGEVGELVVRGGHVMQGYWNDAEATARALRPGRWPWEKVLHTGDLFRMDEDGFFYFVARRDDIIKTRGEKVSPREVENVLYALPGIREAALVGVPDPVLGRSLKAFVVLDEHVALSPRDIIAHCAAHLEDFMVPRQIEIRAALPRTGTGKIRRSALQAEVDGRELPGDDD